MPQPDPSWLEDVRERVRRLGADLGEMAQARWQLARLELGAAATAFRRLAVVLAVAVTLVLTALPLLLAALAEVLDGQLGISHSAWLVIFGSVLLVTAAAAAWLAWRGFRRLAAFQETLEELQEDAAWLREWTKTRMKDEG